MLDPNDIHWFAKSGDLESLRCAIASGVDVNGKNKFGSTALHAAIAGQHCEVVDELLAFGADASIQDRDGFTALHYAAEYNLPHVLESLLKTCPSAISICDRHGNQPLWTAAFNARGKYELVSMLLQYGADSEHRNNSGRSPLDFTRFIGDTALLQLLESRGRQNPK